MHLRSVAAVIVVVLAGWSQALAAPAVTGVSPDNGPVATQVQVSGSGFGASQGTSTVAFYPFSQNASVVSWSDTQIVAVVPSSATSGAVRVTVGGVQSNTNVYFTVPGPVVTSVSPTSGVVGTQVTVTGSGFQATQLTYSTIAFKGYNGTVVSWSDTQIVAKIPSGTSTGPVAVTVNGVTSNQDVLFTLPNPVISGVSPGSAPVGTTVQILGSGFGATQGTSSVTFTNSVNAAVTSWSDTAITVTVPNRATTGPIKVAVGGVTSNSNIYFTVPAPQVNSVSPTSGVVGIRVTVNGSGFQASQGSSSIAFNGTTASVVSWSDTQVIATVPSYATTGPVQVTVNGIGSNQDVAFALPNPIISNVSPSSSSVGTTVQVNGSGFGSTQGSSTTTFNGVNATVSSWSDTSIAATVPASATTGPVKVTEGGVPSNTNIYFTIPAPQVTTVSPTSGVVGTQVTVNGSGFQNTQGTSSVAFNGYPASVTSWSNTQIVATVPTSATTGPVRVIVNGTYSNQDVAFSMPNPVVASLAPVRGPIGSSVQINGTGFGASQGSSTVSLNSTTLAVTSWSDTAIIATIPTGAASGQIKVTEGGVASNTISFTVGSLLVSSVSPAAGPVGAQVTVAGVGFGTSQGSSTIYFNGISAIASSWSDTQIVVTVPTGATTGAVKVIKGGVNSNTDVVFTVGSVVISGVSPSSGPGGTQVVVSGSGFGASQGGSSLTFNGSNTTIVSWSDTQITAKIPSGTNTGPLKATVGGVASNTNVGFMVVVPQVSSLSPTSGPIGTQVQINGAGFGASQGSSTITFNYANATVFSWSDTQIVATVPTTAQTGAVRVNVGGWTSNSNLNFTIPAPQVTSISPASGGVGTQVTITGTGFQATRGVVAINSWSLSVVSWSDTQIVATVSSAGGTGPVRVTAYNNIPSNQDVVFTMANPVVASIVPSSGPVGTQVQVNGSGFGAMQGSSTLTFNGTGVTPTTWSDTQITLTVPTSVSVAPVAVTVGGVKSNSNLYFTVPAPHVTSISPSSGPVGTQVTISGTGFQASRGNGGVKINNAFVSIVSWADTQIVATVATAVGTGPVQVFPNNGASSNADVVFAMPNPIVTGLVPTSGPVGTQVTINGSGFGVSQGTGGVQFYNTVSATVVSWSNTQIVATVPANASSGPVVVNAGGIASGSNVDFTIPAPHITSLSPTLAGAGRSVTISGTGFQATRPSQSWIYFNNYSANATSWSDTQVVATVPSGATTGPVYATINGVSSNYANFTVPLNVVSGVSPTSGPVGTQVTVSGSGFGTTQGASTLSFHGSAASIVSWSNTSIVATVPVTATTGPVEVTVNGTLSNNTVSYTVPPPAITSISPAGGGIGTSVTITGSGFQANQRNSTINFNGTAATPTSWSDTQIVAPVPTGATSGPITVVVNSVVSNNSSSFSAVNPVIASLAPPQGAVGGTVILNGTGFGPTVSNATVTVNGLSAGYSSWTDTAVAIQIPSGATTGPIRINNWGVSSNSMNFTVAPPPSVSSISPTTGSAGSTVTINGSDFGPSQSNSTIDFNGAIANVTSWSDTQILATVPSTTISGPVNVTVAALIGQGPTFYLDAITQVKDSNNNPTTYTSTMVGGSWYMTSSSGPGCSTCSVRGSVQRTYDNNGNMLSETDANGHTVNYTYDSTNNMQTKTAYLDDGTPVTYSYTYNSFGEVLTMTDPSNQVTTNTYDTNGNLKSVTTPAPDGQTPASVTQFTYDTKGELTQITDPLLHNTTLTYYPTGLIQTITDANNNTTSYAYDARGNRTSVIDPINGSTHPTTFAYDLMNRLTGITYPDGTSASFGYDARGRRTSATDQNNRTTYYAYDDGDRLVTVTDAANNVTTYGYDTESNLTSITDANNHTTYFAYDAFGRVTQTTFPSTLFETYGYDAVGNLTSKTDRKNQTIQYVYDALNRLKSKVYPDTTTANYVYDLVGKIKQVTDPTGTYGFAYDNMGRLIGTTTQYSFLPGFNYQNSYTYDAASNRKSLTAPDGSTTSYNYDVLNRLSTLTNSLTGQFGFTYDALSRRTQLTRPNGINTNYSYDSVSRLLSVLHQAGSTTVDGESYTYDNAGNRATKTNYLNGITEGYTYDLIYQLTQVTQGASTTESYTYDAVGNRLSSSSVPSYNYNASNELTSSSNGSYTYDANGNTLSDAPGRSYTWDFENRLTQVVNPGVGTTTFRYDPFGRRIQKSGPVSLANYLYDGPNLVEELDNSGNVLARYSQGDEIDEPLSELRSGTTSYYEQDGINSVTSLSSGTGALANTYTYDSFGNLAASTGSITNPFRYTGREFDSETGIYEYRHRYYDQSAGHFISEDPIAFDGGLHFYRYVNNNPEILVDQMGLYSSSDIMAAWNHYCDGTGTPWTTNFGSINWGNTSESVLAKVRAMVGGGCAKRTIPVSFQYGAQTAGADRWIIGRHEVKVQAQSRSTAIAHGHLAATCLQPWVTTHMTLIHQIEVLLERRSHGLEDTAHSARTNRSI